MQPAAASQRPAGAQRTPRPAATPAPVRQAARAQPARHGGSIWGVARAMGRDLRQGYGVAAHLGWSAVGAKLGTALLRAGAGTTWFAGTASGVALGLQLAVPGTLLVTLLAGLYAQATQLGTQQQTLGAPLGARTASLVTGSLGLSVGLGLAPLVAGAAVVPLAAALTAAVGGAVAAGANAAWLKGGWSPGFDLPTVACLMAATATAPLTWSLLAGTTVGAALGTVLAVGCLGLGAAMVHVFLWRNEGLAQFTPYADGHRVAPAVVQAHRADCLGEASPTVFNVPPALVTRLTQLKAAQRCDAAGRAYFLGMPVILLDGSPGSGKTSMGHAIAQKLDAELLRTSASMLGRVTIAGHPTALVRLMTLIGQAELRALRTGRLHVLFVDEAAALFGRELDAATPEGLTKLRGLGKLMLQLSLQNPRRNGVVLVIADDQLDACRNTLLALSPQPLTTLGRPTAAQLGRIYDHALTQMLAEHARAWPAAVVGPAARHEGLRALRPLVVALAERGAWGRDAATVVGRMARAGEALHADADAHGAARVLDAMAAAGRRAVQLAHGELAARPAVVAPVAAPTEPPDAEALDAALRQFLAGAVLDDPAGALLNWLGGQAGRNLSPMQYVDYSNIEGSYAGTAQQVVQRLSLDVDTVTAYLRECAQALARGGPADDPLTGPSWAAPGAAAGVVAGTPTFFADVTVPAHWSWVQLLVGTRTQPRTRDGAEPYAAYSNLQRLYVMLRQRQDGQRRDLYRSELCVL